MPRQRMRPGECYHIMTRLRPAIEADHCVGLPTPRQGIDEMSFPAVPEAKAQH